MNFIEFSERGEDGFAIEHVLNMNYVTRIQHFHDKDKVEVAIVFYQLMIPYTSNQMVFTGEGAASLWQAYNTWRANQRIMMMVQ